MGENIYYNPEKFGLTTVGEIDTGGLYEFDTFVVFKDGDGRLFYTSDSGCSCPTPFEGQGVSDLRRVTSADELRVAIDANYEYSKPGPDEVARLVALCWPQEPLHAPK